MHLLNQGMHVSKSALLKLAAALPVGSWQRQAILADLAHPPQEPTLKFEALGRGLAGMTLKKVPKYDEDWVGDGCVRITWGTREKVLTLRQYESFVKELEHSLDWARRV